MDNISVTKVTRVVIVSMYVTLIEILNVITTQGRRKEYKIGPTIWKEPQSENHRSDQNSENIRLWP